MNEYIWSFTGGITRHRVPEIYCDEKCGRRKGYRGQTDRDILANTDGGTPRQRASLVYGHEIKLVSVRTTAYTINYKNGGLSTTIKRKCAFRINDDHFDMRHHVVATPLGHLASLAEANGTNELFQGMMVENVIYKRNDPAMSLVHLGMTNAYHITNKSGCLRGHVKTATDEEVYRLMVKKPKNAEKGYPHKPGYIMMA